jgi:hypothetical protein
VACQVPALAWDDKLAASAKAWASTCQFAVSGTPGVGEGLGFGYSSMPEAVKDWYGQVRHSRGTAEACQVCLCTKSIELLHHKRMNVLTTKVL